jgi:hypothetical protein
MKMSSGMRYEFVSRSYSLAHSIPFEFQKGKPEEKAREWTAKPRKLSPGFVGGGLKCAALMVSPGKMSR